MNWMRLKSASRFCARLLIARVLARPGRPSISTLPLARRAAINRCHHPFLPDDRLVHPRLKVENRLARGPAGPVAAFRLGAIGAHQGHASQKPCVRCVFV